ncbi:MAG: glycine betaine ABC transporter substrate-binding protein [Thermoleophilaceae bacterium]
MAACGSSNDNKSSSNTQTTGASAQPGKGKPAVTIGAKNFTEQFILGQLYTQALKAKGYTVSLKQNIGSSEIIDKALTSGSVDMYPEYVGIILTAVAHDSAKPKSAADAFQKAKQFEEGRGFTVLPKTTFSNTDAIGVTKAFAQKNALTSVADLKKVSSFKLGGPPEFKTRDTGIVGLKKDYGLNNIKFVPLAIGLQYKALDSGKVDAADVFTTDGQLQGGKYTVLKDPKNTFGFQNVAPVVSKKVLSKEGPEFASTINAVSAKLTVEAMQKMNAAVDLDKQDPKSVAQQFLSANGLV